MLSRRMVASFVGLDFLYAVVLYFTSAQPWLSVALIVATPLLNAGALLLTPWGIRAVEFTLWPTILFCVAGVFVAGSGSPGWVQSLSLMFVALITLRQVVLRAVFALLLTAGIAVAIHQVGHDIVAVAGVVAALCLLGTLTTSVIGHFAAQNERLAQEVASKNAVLQELASARDAAVRANRAKTAFLAKMSHEIRTPMNAILGFAQILSRQSPLTKEQSKSIEVISTSGQYLLDVLNGILEISRIEAGKLTLREAPFDLFRLVNEVEALFQPRAQEKGIELSVSFEENVPRYVQTDGGKLRQVLVNLVENGIRSTSTGSVAIRLRASRDPAGVSLVDFEVADTGCGIDPEDIERLFNAFEQGDRDQRPGAGTGLGLAIATAYVRLLRGTLRVESVPGEGSVFGFSVALTERGSEGAIRIIESRRPDGIVGRSDEVRILVVDDQETNRLLLRHYLEPIGFIVREARDGVAAFDLCGTWSPHLVLMDLMMPHLGGLEATRRINQEFDAVAVVALTADTLDSNKEQVLGFGAVAVVRKPFDAEELLGVIGRTLDLEYDYSPKQTTMVNDENFSVPTLAQLSGEWRAKIRSASIACDIDELEALLDELVEQEPRLAVQMRRAVANYEYATVLRWLDQAEGKPLT